MTTVTFGWPPRDLSPNARAHWSRKAKATKAYRKACWTLSLEAFGNKIIATSWPEIHVWLTYHPPSRRHYDMDNCVAASKAALDGLADALGVNDRSFIIHPFMSDEIGGMVKVRISPGP